MKKNNSIAIGAVWVAAAVICWHAPEFTSTVIIGAVLATFALA